MAPPTDAPPSDDPNVAGLATRNEPGAQGGKTVATLAIGFGWGGWMLGSTAKTLADNTASSAVVAAIAPICGDQFQRSADAANNLTALKKTDSWQQAAYVEKGGWAAMPGSKAADSGVSQACAAAILSATKQATRAECEGQLNRD